MARSQLIAGTMTMWARESDGSHGKQEEGVL